MGERRLRPVEVALEQVGQPLGVEHRGPVGAGRAEPGQRRRRRRRASWPGRAGTGWPAGRPACPRPCRRPAASPVGGSDSATAAQRSASPGRPSSAKIRAPCAIIAGVCGAGDRLPSCSIQRSTVSICPLAHTCCMASSTSRPKRLGVTGQVGVVDRALGLAVRLEPRGGPGVQLRTGPGVVSARSSACEQLPQQRVAAVPPVLAASADTHEQVPRAQPLEQPGRRPVPPTTASRQRPAHPVEDRRTDQEPPLASATGGPGPPSRR